MLLITGIKETIIVNLGLESLGKVADSFHDMVDFIYLKLC